ncbi:hypothetical protein JRQ81_008336 [Phrynocephalus forsythii]|uniref:Uncharacterized protein n=1 Tax=Phrynocephalus forsythii TaxID=171643 RepID=A0A9Q0XBV9_9SAUR|nr:hypothetical protein JRQ81_008336 [Phrynocephalus forsythii]
MAAHLRRQQVTTIITTTFLTSPLLTSITTTTLSTTCTQALQLPYILYSNMRLRQRLQQQQRPPLPPC